MGGHDRLRPARKIEAVDDGTGGTRYQGKKRFRRRDNRFVCIPAAGIHAALRALQRELFTEGQRFGISPGSDNNGIPRVGSINGFLDRTLVPGYVDRARPCQSSGHHQRECE